MIPEAQLFTGKDLTFPIEQDNSNIRHCLARFRRRTKVVSRCSTMVDLSLRLLHHLQQPAAFAGYARRLVTIFGWNSQIFVPNGRTKLPCVGLLSWSRLRPINHDILLTLETIMSSVGAQPRLLTPAEVAAIVKAMRDQMTWSQELLSELAGVPLRTFQSLEAGQPSSTSTRRDVAAAFGWPQDFFDVPQVIPTKADLAAQQATFHLEYLILDATPVDGRDIITRLVETAGHRAMMPCSLAQLPRDAQHAFAAIAGYVHGRLDAICDATMTAALIHGDALSALTVPLLDAGYQLHLAVRKAMVSNPAWADPTPMPLTVLYVVAAPEDNAVGHVAVKRRIAM